MQKIKDSILLFLALLLLVWVIITMQKCNTSKVGLNTKNDTTIIYHRDTIWTKDTIYTFKHIKVPVSVYNTDTFIKPIYIDTNDCRRIFVYKDSLVDSNLIIYYKDYIQGILRDKEMSYKLKIPLRIYDSVKETIIKRPKFSITGGLIGSKGLVAPILEVGYKRISIGLGYNLISNSPVVSYKYLLFSK